MTVVMQIGFGAPWTQQGTGKRQVVDWTLDHTQIQAFDLQFRRAGSMSVSFPSGNEPPWTVGLNGSTAISNSFGQCVNQMTAHAGQAPAAPAGPTQPYAQTQTQPATQEPTQQCCHHGEERRMTKGRCLCGAIRYEYSGEPTLTVHCHCESCRRQTSSPVTTFIIVPKAAVRLTSGQPKEFASSSGVWRSFCDTCGSPIYYRSDRRADAIDLYACTLEDVTALTPQCHVHAVEQLPWFEVVDELPRYAGSRFNTAPLRVGMRKP